MSIARHVRQAPLSADTPLPTVRSLAAELGVSASTVSDAWRILRARGVIDTDRRRGTTVRLDRTAAGGRAWHVPVEPGALAVDLSTGTPDPALLPDLGGALLQATDDHQVTSYLDRPVLPALEVELRRRWPFDPGRITLLDGAQDALDRLIDATVNFGDRVIVETPTFLSVLRHARTRRRRCDRRPGGSRRPVVDAVGSRALDRIRPSPSCSRRIPATAVSPSARPGRQPCTIRRPTMCSSSRTTTPAWSQGTFPSLGVHRPDRTVHVHSFSKSHGPDLRLAAVGGPSEIIDAVVRRRQLGRLDLAAPAASPCSALTDPAAEAAVAMPSRPISSVAGPSSAPSTGPGSRSIPAVRVSTSGSRSTTSATPSWPLRPAASVPRQADRSRSAMAAVTTSV